VFLPQLWQDWLSSVWRLSTISKTAQTSIGENMKSIAAIAILGLALSGCGYKEVNQMIADSNVQRLQAYADGMKACGVNAACQVGLSMAFAGNMGQQDLIRPESVKDYVVAITPLVSVLGQWFQTSNSSGEDGIDMSGSIGSTLNVFKGNTMDNSQAYAQITPTNTYTHEINTQTGTDDSANTGQYYYQPTDTK